MTNPLTVRPAAAAAPLVGVHSSTGGAQLLRPLLVSIDRRCHNPREPQRVQYRDSDERLDEWPRSGPSSRVGLRGGASAWRFVSSTTGCTAETMLTRSLALATREGRSVGTATFSGWGMRWQIWHVTNVPDVPVGPRVLCHDEVAGGIGPAASVSDEDARGVDSDQPPTLLTSRLADLLQ